MKENWMKLWEREYTLNRMGQVLESLVSDFGRSKIGFRANKIAAITMPGGNAAFCSEVKNWDKYYKYIKNTFLQHKKFKRFLRDYRKSKKEFLEISRYAGNKAQTANKNGLTKLFKDFLVANSRFLTIGQFAAFYLNEFGDETAKNLVGNQKVNIVLVPEKMSEIRKERLNLLKIALEKDGREQQELLKEHTRRFSWIPCINVLDPPPWDFYFFESELRKIRTENVKKELDILIKTFQRNKRNYRGFRRQFGGRKGTLLDNAHAMAFIKDDRDDARRKAYYYSRPLYFAVAKALKLDPENLMLHTDDEIVNALSKEQGLPRKGLSNRKKGYALVIERNKIFVKTGNNYRKFLELVLAKVKNVKQFDGVSASKGKVRGKARVILNAFTLNKMQKGDILVTVATHPDYLPAMRKAKAIITDEGGLTSHAAIVSRELGIPCIVGTKIATKVFKDGDIVEVDANQGILRKLH